MGRECFFLEINWGGGDIEWKYIIVYFIASQYFLTLWKFVVIMDINQYALVDII